VSQGAHTTVAQRAEDELRVAPGGCDAAYPAAAAVCNPFPQHHHRARFENGLDRLDRGTTVEAAGTEQRFGAGDTGP
jgi:hypothetical protein